MKTFLNAPKHFIPIYMATTENRTFQIHQYYTVQYVVLHWTQRTTYHSFISSEQVLNQVISHSHRWKSQMEMVSLFDQKIYNIKLKISSFLYIPGTSYLVYKCITFCTMHQYVLIAWLFKFSVGLIKNAFIHQHEKRQVYDLDR